jgi:hypothetical protein
VLHVSQSGQWKDRPRGSYAALETSQEDKGDSSASVCWMMSSVYQDKAVVSIRMRFSSAKTLSSKTHLHSQPTNNFTLRFMSHPLCLDSLHISSLFVVLSAIRLKVCPTGALALQLQRRFLNALRDCTRHSACLRKVGI